MERCRFRLIAIIPEKTDRCDTKLTNIIQSKVKVDAMDDNISQIPSNFTNITEQIDEYSLFGQIGCAFFFTCLIICTCIGNTLVLLTVAKTPSLRTNSNCLIVNLACADLGCGMLAMPLSALMFFIKTWPSGLNICGIWSFIDVLTTNSSIYILVVISVDRYIGVTRPLHHKLIVTSKRIVIVIVLVWMLSLATALPTYFWKPEPQSTQCDVNMEVGNGAFSVIWTFYFPMFVVIGLYIKIYLVIKTGAFTKDLPEQNNASSCPSPSKNIHSVNNKYLVSQPSHKLFNKHEAAEKMKKEVKTTKTLAKVVGLFIFCWLPFFILLPVVVIFPDLSVPRWLLEAVFWLGYCNSAMNPFIYANSNKKFRSAFIRLLRCSKTRKKNISKYVIEDQDTQN